MSRWIHPLCLNHEEKHVAAAEIPWPAALQEQLRG
jgi:hypothetical protein